MGKRKDFTGLKVGKLTVLRPTKLELNRRRKKTNGVEYEEYSQYWWCKCDCGNEREVRDKILNAVLSGKGVGSCGCGRRKDSDGDKWPVAFNVVWGTYISHAKSYNRVFTLTKEDFFKLTNDNCHYCGSAPSSVQSSRNKGTKGWSKEATYYKYNGVDRVDNSKGYEISNCVTCCETCNRMKLAQDQATFLGHVTKIYNFSIARQELP